MGDDIDRSSETGFEDIWLSLHSLNHASPKQTSGQRQWGSFHEPVVRHIAHN